MKFSSITNGRYFVELRLNKYLSPEQFRLFEQQHEEIKQHDKNFGEICELKGDTLLYQSETLLPITEDKTKENVLIIFGNPATHSVKNDMFFFSKANLKRHSMWGKLAIAGLVAKTRSNKQKLREARKEESDKRKEMIHSGTSSEKFLVGFSTFYSFPTPVEKGFRFSNVAGVENLFAPMLDILVGAEVQRIKSYEFFKNAKLVFVQKSSFNAFCRASDNVPLFWPIRGKGASGKNLAKLLKHTQPMVEIY